MATCRHTPQNSWWEHDARGIPVALVCHHCKAQRLAGFRRDVLENPNYEADEQIEPDEETGPERTGRQWDSRYEDAEMYPGGAANRDVRGFNDDAEDPDEFYNGGN